VKFKCKNVLVTGNFNVLHAGHLRLFKFAKECGEQLLVGVNSDRIAGDGSYVHESLRLECVHNSNWVDEAFLVDDLIEDVIDRIRPDIIVKGKEHESSFNPELAAINKFGGKLLFSSGETVFSSIDLIRKSFYDPIINGIQLPREFLSQHAIQADKLRSLIHHFGNLKVCVIGDLIVDEYITCQPLGMSQEDPTIVVTPIDSTRFLGGAAIVAAHAAGLGASVQFISVTGNDVSHDFSARELSKAGVNTHLLKDISRPTTLKQRYRSSGKSLLRVSHLHQGAISLDLQDEIMSIVERVLLNADVLVFSDFNYGCLPQLLVDKIIAIAKERGVMLAADSQSSSQMGDINRFQSMDLICPTEREARISTRNREDGLVVLTEQLRAQSKAKNILLKLGEEGLLIHAGSSSESDKWLTDRIGALNLNPKDVAGAGDSLLIASTMAIVSGGSIWEAAVIGSIAAALQISRVGNTPLHAKELLKELDELRN
jgi:rfaE bifunctional protein kinase chain/domain